jgi:hypothetical protein
LFLIGWAKAMGQTNGAHSCLYCVRVRVWGGMERKKSLYHDDPYLNFDTDALISSNMDFVICPLPIGN